MRKPRATFIGFGEVNTPPEIILRKCEQAKDLLCAGGCEILSTSPVTDDPQGKDVRRAIDELRSADVDLVVACIAGWIPSHAVIRVLSEFKHHPILLWGLAGATEGNRLVTTAAQAGTTALRQTLNDLEYRFKYVVTYLDAPPPLGEIFRFARCAAAVKQLRDARIGSMGYRDMQLYNTLYDGVSLTRQLGVEIEFFEMLEIVQRSERFDSETVQKIRFDIQKKWVFETPASPEMLDKGIRYYLAIRERAIARNYRGVSLIDVDGMKALLQYPPAMIFMLLADELQICTIPENDILGAVTQVITRELTGQIGSYLEFYEFLSDGALMGVPDYVPSEIVDGQTRVRPSSFGHLAGGILNVSKIKTGQITLCRLGQRKGDLVLHIVRGMAKSPRPWEEAGWAPPAPQLPGIEFVLDGDMEVFSQNIMGQHYILSYGDNTNLFSEFCKLTGIGEIR